MPAKSKKQEKFMNAIAHNKDFSKKVGVSQKVAKEILKAFEPITKANIPEAVTRPIKSVATQQGLQRGLLDQFLSDNRSEVERRQTMKSKFEQDNQNRVEK